MSFILDALKKSEHERQRQAIPGLVEASIARPRQRLPIWALALIALLGINLVVLLIVLARGWMTSSTSPGQVAAAAATAGSAGLGAVKAAAARAGAEAAGSDGAEPADTAAGAAPAGAAAGPAAGTGTGTDDKQWSPLDNTPADAGSVFAPEVPVAPVTPQPASPAPRQQAPSEGPAVHQTRRRDPVLNDGDYKADEEETLPSVNELNLSGPQALPELHLDVHVFATNSAERFVFINMRKYHEGATLQEGPTVERIRRDGVILNYQGLRFLLPRQ